MQIATLCFLVKDNKVLLGYKKRGFGVDRWNGIGGKIESGEHQDDCIIREVHEEIGVTIPSEALQRRGEIKFYFDDTKTTDLHVYVYAADQWQGEPAESEEMRPQWFDIDRVPLAEMWIDDQYWLPQFLKGKDVFAEFHFSKDFSTITSYKITHERN